MQVRERMQQKLRPVIILYRYKNVQFHVTYHDLP